MEKKSVVIFGAGYAGLMAAYHLSKTRKVIVLEKKKEIVSNHSALFRFNEDISSVIPIPLEKVVVRKNIYYKDRLYNESNILLNNLYSYKTTGKYTERSIMNISDGVRYIPPADYFSKLKGLCENNGVEFRTGYNIIDDDFNQISYHKVSTLPLPMSLRLLGMNEDLKLFGNNTKQIYTLNFEVPNMNLHQTIYCPDFCDDGLPEYKIYRVSAIGNRMIIELNGLPDLSLSLHDFLANTFGLFDDKRFTVDCWNFGGVNSQPLGKLIKIDEKKRKELVYKITKQTGTYSLGRFATWRQIMTPEVIKDILRIEQWLDLDGLSDYDKQKAVKL